MAYKYEIVHTKHEYLMRYHSKKYFWEDHGSRRAGKHLIWCLTACQVVLREPMDPRATQTPSSGKNGIQQHGKSSVMRQPLEKIGALHSHSHGAGSVSCSEFLMFMLWNHKAWCTQCDSVTIQLRTDMRHKSICFGAHHEHNFMHPAYFQVMYVMIYNLWRLASWMIAEYILYMSLKCALSCELIDVPSLCPRRALTVPSKCPCVSHFFTPIPPSVTCAQTIFLLMQLDSGR